MDAKGNADPPGKEGRSSGVWSRVTKFFGNLFERAPEAKLTSTQRDALIDKSIEEFSKFIALADNKLEKTAKDMIRGIIDLSDTAVKEIMVPRVDMVGVEQGTSIRDLIELVKRAGHSRFPLYEGSLDEIKGILYIKDIFVESLNSGGVILENKARPPYFVPENKRVSELLKEMQKRKIHLAIVVDEFGGTAGLVTLEDILEEIVGEIEDEYDLGDSVIRKFDNTRYSVKGSLPIHVLNEQLGLDLPEDEFETVGGVIYDIVGSLPKQGTTVDYRSIRLTADRVVGQRIARVLVEIKPEQPSGKIETSG